MSVGGAPTPQSPAPSRCYVAEHQAFADMEESQRADGIEAILSSPCGNRAQSGEGHRLIGDRDLDSGCREGWDTVAAEVDEPLGWKREHRGAGLSKDARQ